MTKSMNKHTVLALALAFAASPLVAVGQTDSGDQSKSKTSSDQAMDSSAQSKTDKDAADEESASMDSEDAASQSASDTGTSTDSDAFIGEQDDSEMLAGNVIGSYVNDASGNSLGSVENLLIDENHEIRAVVVGVGGFLGIGTKAVAVDIDKIEQSRADDGTLELTLSASKEQLQNAPTFKTLIQKKAEQKAKERGQKAQEKVQQQQSGSATSGGSGDAATSGGSGSAN